MAQYYVKSENDTENKVSVYGTDREFRIMAETWYNDLKGRYIGNNDILVIPELNYIVAAKTVLDICRLYKDEMFSVELTPEFMICTVEKYTGSKTGFSSSFRFRRVASVQTFHCNPDFQHYSHHDRKGKIIFSHFVGLTYTGQVASFEPVPGIKFANVEPVQVETAVIVEVTPEPAKIEPEPIKVAEPTPATPEPVKVVKKAVKRRMSTIKTGIASYYPKYNDPSYLKAAW